jgi:hypothetical protein
MRLFGAASRVVGLALIALASALVGGDVVAGALTPVTVNQLGPKRIQIEVSAGRVQPCDSSYNAPMFKGWVDPGTSLTLRAPHGCICYRHTYGEFPSVDWSTSRTVCRAACRLPGPPAYCGPDPNDQIVIDVTSDR